jgi:hypothetical protein
MRDGVTERWSILVMLRRKTKTKTIKEVTQMGSEKRMLALVFWKGIPRL